MVELQQLTSGDAVRQAIREFDRLGRSAFLKQHRFERSNDYFIDHDGRYYDAAAIAAVAYGIQHPLERALVGKDLNGKGYALEKALRRLDFRVVANPYHYLVLAENEVHARAEFSKWQDVTGERYHFPNSYRNKILPGREFLYYKGGRRRDGERATPQYFGWGRIGSVYPDPTTADVPKAKRQWMCDIEEYREFRAPVMFRNSKGLYLELGSPDAPRRYWENGVRAISDRCFQGILEAAGIAFKQASERRTVETQTIAVVDGPLELLVLTEPDIGSARVAENIGHRTRRSPRAKAIGDKGEQIFLNWLRDQLETDEEKAKIVWTAEEGATPGWDIEDQRDRQRCVAYEVKATNGKKLPAIEISANEWNAAATLRVRYNLVIVAECESNHPRIQIINDPWSLFEKNQLSAAPTAYRLIRRE